MTNGRVGKWMCPNCGRNFARKNQSHSCELFSIKEHHFKKGTPFSIQIYNQFISIFQKFGPISIEPLKNIIALKKKFPILLHSDSKKGFENHISFIYFSFKFPF